MSNRHDATPAALYARVSSDRQDVDLSVAAQLRALREYANKNGYLVVREFVDEAESGRIADRPQFRKMIDEAGKSNAPFQEILVWKFSRFTRKREHAVAFKSMLRRKGVRVVSITEHADDTPTGKLMEAIIESIDEFYSENLAEEVKRGMREAASRGYWMGSRTPYGYSRVMVADGAKKRPTLELDPDAAQVLRRIFDLAEAGTRNAENHPHPQRRGHRPALRASSGPRTASTSSSGNEVYTGTLIWGARGKDKGRAGAHREGFSRRRHQGPVPPRQQADAPPAPPSGLTPGGWAAPTCSADWSSATSASGPFPARTPRVDSSPTTSASP